MAEKVTTMTLMVDLQCHSCYKKVKKILGKFPQIREQVYDEKENVVTITVVCCISEKIVDKLYCEGGEAIQCIKIVEPPPPPPPGQDEQPGGSEGGKTKPPKPCSHPPVPVGFCCAPCSKGYGGGPCYYGHGWPMPPPPCHDSYSYGYEYGYEYGYGYKYGSVYGKGYPHSHCDYFSEENTGGCKNM